MYINLDVTFHLFFPVQEYLLRLEEAKKYDHRILGVKQELILHHEWRFCGLLLSD